MLKQGFDHLYQIFGHLYKFLDSLEFIEGSAIVGDWCVEASVRLPVPFHQLQVLQPHPLSHYGGGFQVLAAHHEVLTLGIFYFGNIVHDDTRYRCDDMDNSP